MSQASHSITLDTTFYNICTKLNKLMIYKLEIRAHSNPNHRKCEGGKRERESKREIVEREREAELRTIHVSV